jgi:methyl-accepting chemotaxis protein
MFMRLSFKVKLSLILAMMSVTTVGLFLLSAVQSGRAFRAGKESQLKATVDGLMDKIDRNLFERYGDVQAYALSEAARSMDPERVTSFINDMMVTYAPVYDMMVVTDARGKVIAASSKNKDGKPINSKFMIGGDYSRAPWFKAAVSNRIKPGSSYVEDLHVDETVGEVLGNSGRVMNFTAPIRDKSTGVVIGVWSNRMSWSDVVEAIVKEESAKIVNDQIVASFAYLVDSKGVFLLHPLSHEYELKKSHDFLQPASMANDKIPVREVPAGETKIDGKLLEAATISKGYSTYPGRGWGALLQVPESDPQTTDRNLLLLFALFAIGAANVVAVFVVRRMSGEFERVVRRLSSESSQVKTSATQISTASQQLSEATTEQAAAIEETAASMEEMASMLSQTNQNASKCMTVAEEGRSEADKGKQVISKMSSAMEEIQAANAKLDRLVGLIDAIENKTKIINDIVFETRLLSFNASIEAARAGAHGKGFAVVAEEVGKLAAMSGKAADEIRNLLASSTEEVTQVVKDTQERVNLGKGVSQECEVAFGAMGEAMTRVTESIRMIAAAAREQETGIKQTNRAMSEMDKVTHSNSRGAETLAGQATQLYSGAESLNLSIHLFRQAVFGAGGGKIAEIGGAAATRSGDDAVPAVLGMPKVMAAEDDGTKTHPAEPPHPKQAEPRPQGRSDSRWKSAG